MVKLARVSQGEKEAAFVLFDRCDFNPIPQYDPEPTRPGQYPASREESLASEPSKS